MRVAVHGVTGRMGRQVVAAVAEDPKAELVAGFARESSAGTGHDAGVFAGLGAASGVTIQSAADMAQALEGADVLIDFSLPDGLPDVFAACGATGTPVVIGTTGFSPELAADLDRLAQKIPLVWAPNFSVGVNVFWALARQAAQLLGPEADAEILEMHHHHKVDAPSGTAQRLLEVVAEARGAGAAAEVAVHGRHGRVGARTRREIGVHALRGGDVVGDHTLVLAAPGERIELTHRAHGREIFARGSVRAAHWLVGRPPGRYGMQDVLGLGG